MPRFELYLAAPFFSEGERAFNEAILRELEPSWRVFSPYRDGVRMAELVADGLDPATAARKVWLCDVERIRECVGVVAVLDGRVPDEGVCVELGLASALGKTVIGLVTDTRTCFRWGANPMITGCLTALCDDLAELSSNVSRFIAPLSNSPAEPRDGCRSGTVEGMVVSETVGVVPQRLVGAYLPAGTG